MADSLEDILECHICAEKYNLTERRPKILNCGHRFCLGCLDLLSKQNNIQCPNCQRVCKIPSEGVRGFTDNFTIIDLMESQNQPVISAEFHGKVTDGMKKLQDTVAIWQAEFLAQNVMESISTTEKKIDETFDKMLQQLQQRKRHLLQEFKDRKEEEMNNLTLMKDFIQKANIFLLKNQLVKDGKMSSHTNYKSTLREIIDECELHTNNFSCVIRKPEFKFRFFTNGHDDLLKELACFGSLVREEEETISKMNVTHNVELPKEIDITCIAKEECTCMYPLQILPLLRSDAPELNMNPSAVASVGNSLFLIDSQQHFIDILVNNVLSCFQVNMPGTKGFYFPCGIAVDTEDNIIVIDNTGTIYVISADGQFINSFSILSRGDVWYSKLPNVGLTCDANNDIYTWCCKYKIIRVFNKYGVLLQDIAPVHSQAKEPFISSICVRNNKMYVTDSYVSIVAVYSTKGNLIKTIGCFGGDRNQFKNPLSVAVDQNGLMLVADSGNQRIQIISPNGEFIGSYCENLDVPCCIVIVDATQVVICDRGKPHLLTSEICDLLPGPYV